MLILHIKKKWYDMIHSGEKKEDYRKLSTYYEARFKNLWQGSLIGFDAKRKIIFRNGYSRKSPSFIATVTLDIGEGKPEWGAEKGENYYILKIHNIDELPYWFGKNCKDCGNEKCKKLGTLPKGYDCALWQPKVENYSVKTVKNAKDAENYPISEDTSKCIEEINKLIFENGQEESEEISERNMKMWQALFKAESEEDDERSY